MGRVGTHRLPHALDLGGCGDYIGVLGDERLLVLGNDAAQERSRRRRERRPRPVADDEARGDGLLYGLKGRYQHGSIPGFDVEPHN
jgi:hypothetical protein